MKELRRCTWAGEDSLYVAYHDLEWGVPAYDDQVLFEFITLEGAQAGLSWLTILRKREGYRKAFKNFDPKKCAKLTEADVERLMNDEGIVRNRLKINSVVTNAKAFLEVQSEFGSFSNYLWGWVDGTSIQNSWDSLEAVPAVTELAEALAKDLKKHGFKFMGPTIVYAFMQAVGLVNDHTTDCFRYREVKKLGKKLA